MPKHRTPASHRAGGVTIPMNAACALDGRSAGAAGRLAGFGPSIGQWCALSTPKETLNEGARAAIA